ncbi:MAG: methyltransferase, partial [Oxalobacteraceae bacterium]
MARIFTYPLTRKYMTSMSEPDNKQYDAHYFRRWYRDAGLADPARLRRKVALAVSQAEYYL